MPDILTPAQVAECRERVERATEGPWEVEGGGGMHMDGTRDWYTISCPWNEHTKYYIGLGALKLPEAEFVAHARTDIPALCATVEALRVENERLRGALKRLVDQVTVDESGKARPMYRHEVEGIAMEALEPQP